MFVDLGHVLDLGLAFVRVELVNAEGVDEDDEVGVTILAGLGWVLFLPREKGEEV